MPSGARSQKQSTNNSDSRSITSVQRDSIYIKLQRGKASADKVKVLNKALADCGASKEVYKQIIDVHKSKAISLELIVQKQEDLANTVKEANDLEKKELKKKNKKSFFTGGAVGVLVTLITLIAVAIL